MAKVEAKRTLEQFDAELKQLFITGQWQYESLLTQCIGGPKPRGEAYLWPWKIVGDKLAEACDVLEESVTARRSLLFNNPGVPMGGTTHTPLMGVQMIKAGEIAWAHRHTLAAVRFVVKGDGKVFTVVNGEKCPMEPNDLIFTPQWTWHDHQNPTRETAMWVDVLDVPFMLGLNQPFYEPYPGDKVQAVRAKGSEYLQQRAGLVRPAWESPQKENLPLRYRWKDVEPQLRGMLKPRQRRRSSMSGSFLFPAVALAQEAAPAGQQPSGIAAILASPLVMMGVIFVIIYLLITRPQQKKQKEMQEMLRNLQKGDKVVTQSGIHGTIASLDEKTITLQVADQVRIKMSRWSVAEKVTDEIGK